MQGHRGSLSTLPENFSFDNGSISSDSDIDPQINWNSMPTSTQNRLSPDETNIQYFHHLRHERYNPEWNFGESSSSAPQIYLNERKTEQAWNFHSRATLSLENRHYEPSNNNVNGISNGDQIPNGSFCLQNSSLNTFPQDLNMSSGFEDLEDDDCQIVEPPNQQMQSGGSSFGILPSGYEDRPGCSLDGRRVSCKRKALEMSVGPSSGTGSSVYQNQERSQLNIVPPAPIAPSNINTPTQTIFTNNGPGPANPRLRLGVGGAIPASFFALTPSENYEISRRNFRLRINGSQHQQDHGNPFLGEANIGNGNPDHLSRSLLRNNLLDMNPVFENGTPHGNYIASVRRNAQTRWSGPSSSRTSPSSASPPISDSSVFEEPAIPRTISEHPMFVPAAEMASSSQNPINWNMPSGNNSAASNSGAGSGLGVNPVGPSWAHRNYPRRLSDFVRRSLLSSAGVEAGGPSSSVNTRETRLSAGSDTHGVRTPISRSALLERNIDGALGIPYSLRTLAAASEGRSNIMSEIRHVLHLMRRGEGLRLEDMMLLDHSVFFGMSDIQDRHRDMRLDVDNMSYEELLALEERIGNVCTGLTEETITSRLKKHKYIDNKANIQLETEPCSICREEYNDGEDMGTLECGHDFHKDCIKQWLVHKNSCPICKKTGLTT